VSGSELHELLLHLALEVAIRIQGFSQGFGRVFNRIEPEGKFGRVNVVDKANSFSQRVLVKENSD
jgi:hypothetical protein